MTTSARVAVVGTGAFATGFIRALLAAAAIPPHLVVLGRGSASLQRATTCAGPGAQPLQVDLGPDTDLTLALRRASPDLIVVAASLHSPYATGTDRWSRLLADTDFGLTTLLQAPIAIRAAEAAARLEIPLINACYPDVINPLLTCMGLPVLCGLGNAHTLTAGLTTPVPMLAHHRHLKPPRHPDDDIAVLATQTEHTTRSELAALRGLPRRELNAIGASAGGALVADMLGGRHLRTNLPGPGGLPGGYPVRVEGLTCQPDLPPALLAEAVTWNRRHSAAEGVQVDHGSLRFHGATAVALRALGVLRGDTLPHHRWAGATWQLLRARAQLGAPTIDGAGSERNTA